jgi:hypothetical protein
MTSDSQDSSQPEFGGSHHLPPYSILCTSLRGPHPNGFLFWDSQRGVSKLLRLELSQLCGAITSCSDLRSGWGLKKSCSSHWKLSNSISHVTCTHGSRVNSWLFVVESQTVNLIPDLSFCHNLCCICPNGSSKPISDIYTLIFFRWYKELFNARCFNLCNRSLKVQESTRTPTPKMRVHLGVWVFMLTLFHTPLGPHPYKPLPWSRTQG